MWEKALNFYDIILFDFDGLLVDTESLHFSAYKEMCLRRGVVLDWDFTRFCQEAHGSAHGIWKAFQKEYPQLLENAPRDLLYREKKEMYQELLKTTSLKYMPGIEALLQALATSNVLSAVVTNSPRFQVECIRKKLTLLHEIPLWITREEYALAKPEPDGYLLAIEKLGKKKRIVGFEDTLKGIRALQAAGVEAILVAPICLEKVKDFMHIKRIDQFLLHCNY